MGVSYYTYVGPYIDIINTKQTIVETYRGCNMPSCKEFKFERTAKFCSHCGSKIVDIPKCVEKNVLLDYYEELNERLSEICGEYKPDQYEDHLLLISNCKEAPGKRFNAFYDNGILPVDSNTIAKELKNFRTFHEKEIEYITNKFGKDNVKVIWGVIVWTN